MKISTIKFLFGLSILLSLPSYAGKMCGIYKNLPSALDYVSCDMIFGNAKGTTLSCDITFKNENAKNKYDVGVYAQKNGKKARFTGRWVGRNDWYLASLAPVDRNTEFQVQFIIEKNSRNYYQSPWISCKK